MSNSNEPTTFEEALQLYIDYRTRYEQLQEDFNTFQDTSMTYEKELELQFKQLEEEIKDLRQQLLVERIENEKYQERTEKAIKQYDHNCDNMKEELNSCKKINEKFKNYIRELEQANDDLERNNRTLIDSLSTFEMQLNRALEQNALLEVELNDKLNLNETVQRLRDETRDLREEIDMLQKTNKGKPMNTIDISKNDSERMKDILSSETPVAFSNPKQVNSSNHKELENIYENDETPADGQTNRTSAPKTPLLLHRRNTIRTGSISLDSSLSNSTRLESLKLINEAFGHFYNIESILSSQRKQSRITTSTNSYRSRYNSVINSDATKIDES